MAEAVVSSEAKCFPRHFYRHRHVTCHRLMHCLSELFYLKCQGTVMARSPSTVLSDLHPLCSNKKLHGEEALVLYLICHLLGKMEKDQGLSYRV
ncbi:uncharacterized protein LOC116923836 isoform X2 [Daphnia magna]|uniref:uncharacterized protein LOC116923836 isoform X2 n=1 Tax=Daphnia magna TaxID=35525 RepID=UPI001E1BD7D0|nr:uncharacterized protein LOC116923836 isoform X2 [Daphnia magna]